MKTRLIAHRGDTKDHPENTVSAFETALKNGADAIELDVHMTRDGELIVHHDYYLGRPDNGEGKIYDRDLSYIQSLKIDGTETIPTLEEVFELIGNDLQYEIELKASTEEFLRKVIALVRKYNLMDMIEFTSPHPYNLTRIKTLEPSSRTGTFVATPPIWMDVKLGQKLAINNALLGNITVLHCPLAMLDTEFIQTAHNNNLLIHAANCDLDTDLRAVFDMGVDQLSTNNLELAHSLRQGQK